MNTMMQETLLSGTAHKAELPGWMAAGKTGTSQDFRDAWFIGYTANLVTGVWLGNDDNSPTKKATGGGLPVEIWTRFMKAAHQGITPVPLPMPAAPPAPIGLLANIAQAVAPSSAPPVYASSVNAPVAANIAVRPAPTRAAASVRPEAANGLDGWLVDRLFGGR
jgi:penicillin-binding protein 1A